LTTYPESKRMMRLQIRELKSAMAASSFALTPPCSLRIGILLSGSGRSLMCIDCNLRCAFPSGTDYGTIAKQLESQCCIRRASSKDDALIEGSLPRSESSGEGSAGMLHLMSPNYPDPQGMKASPELQAFLHQLREKATARSNHSDSTDNTH